MTVLEYFDYEKQLLKDYEAVKTPHAKAAVFKTLMDTLDTHRQFVYNTISSFENSAKAAWKNVGQAAAGKTPDYVSDMMAEFGFHELEEAPPDEFDMIATQSEFDKVMHPRRERKGKKKGKSSK